MKTPDTPSSESLRLKTLQDTELLDSNPESRFDRLTRMAQRVFDVPIALVSLVDSNRQWFKSCIGLPVRETSREISFCGHAILDDEIFVIEDASLDPRFADNPLVTGEPFIRFYAGYPLRALNGEKMGTLCIIDSKPRQFTLEDRNTLKDLGKMAEQEIRVTEMALHDELTGLANRRGFSILAHQMLKMSDRQMQPLVLAYFDLDNFKTINDSQGHAMGDEALRIFAQTLQRTAREADLLARIGGDEFVWMFVNFPEDFSERLLNRFKRNIESFNEKNKQNFEIHYSVGISPYKPRSNIGIDQLMADADEKMFEQKN